MGQYLGDVIDGNAMKSAIDDCGGDYIMALHSNEWVTQGLYIDARQMGNIFRFVNHSCEPNCQVLRWNDGQLPCLIFRALSEVAEGEELTYDYGYEVFDRGNGFKCHCGKPKCRVWIGKENRGLKRKMEEETVVE